MIATNVVFRWRLSVSTCLILLSGSLPAGLAASEPVEETRPARTWTDSSGTYTVTATLLTSKDGSVRLQKANGKEISVPLAKLSSPDRSYVRAELRREALARRNKLASDAQPKPDARLRGLRFGDDRVVAAEFESAPQQLFGINWYNSPKNALEAAAIRKDKPVMWFRVLGELDGFM